MVVEEKEESSMAVAEGGGESEEKPEEEYESDTEEVVVKRRSHASDDEEGEREREEKRRSDPRVGVGSDCESDGQGGVEVYDDEESEIEEEEEEVEEEEFEEKVSEEGDNVVAEGEVGVQVDVQESDGDGQRSNEEQGENEGKSPVEGEKKENEPKENEPFAVPTAGAFYMHDDRFRDNGSGRQRRTPGGRKLWESRDDRKWGHDKFEEMNMQEAPYEKERRNSKGQHRGWGKSRGLDRGGARRSRSRSYDDRKDQNQTSRSVRGRGPRRYEPPSRNNRESLPTHQNKQSGKATEKTSHASSGRMSTNVQTSDVHSDPAPPRKQVFASSLSSTSPPFYPSGSSNQGVSSTQKRDLPIGNTNKSPPVTAEDKFSAPSGAFMRGKAVTDSFGQDRLYIDESIRPVMGKLTNLQLQSSGPSPITTTPPAQNKPKGRAPASSGHVYQQSLPIDQVRKVSQQLQPAFNQGPLQNTLQPSSKSSQQLVQHAGNGSQSSSPCKVSPSSSEPGELDSPPGSSKSKSALIGKGKTNVQGSGQGTFLYNGAQLMGAAGSMGVSHGDQNFPGTPAFFPVMHFGGQHPGGLGVPAVGMALPGYVGQPGIGNSEMTLLPLLAGAPGSLGATYCSPYLAVDGGFYSRPAGQTTSSTGSSKETSTNKPNNGLKPPKSELVNDEFGQRQNKPRRYSEMSFGQ